MRRFSELFWSDMDVRLAMMLACLPVVQGRSEGLAIMDEVLAEGSILCWGVERECCAGVWPVKSTLSYLNFMSSGQNVPRARYMQ